MKTQYKKGWQVARMPDVKIQHCKKMLKKKNDVNQVKKHLYEWWNLSNLERH